MNNELAELLFPHITKTPEYYENLYKPRDLKEGEIVTRFAPSPTGFVHMGSLYVSFIDRTLADQFGGVFYLRIEDTDEKREVENGIQIIKDAFDYFKINIDESPFNGGNYGPYIQSERKEIYQTYVKDLIRKGLAYPCFCTEEELEETRNTQTLSKIKIGYYGDYAKCRVLSLEDVKNKLSNNESYVIRLKTPVVRDEKIECIDEIKGSIMFPVNDIDIVLLKSDGQTTYHFAHAVDDHLMKTTHVIRGDEWLASFPLHLQLFNMLGFEPPKYAHISPLTKKEGDTVRKLSKRKDPESAISYYQELGIPVEAMKLYFATILNSNFEQWYEQNKDKSLKDFTFTFDKMPVGGTLYDVEKLNNICKIYFSRKTNLELYNESLEYFKEYDKEFYDILTKDKDYSLQVLNIERDVPRPRMDIGCYKDIKKENSYMYDELFYYSISLEDKKYNTEVLDEYLKTLDLNDDKDTWWNKVKELANKLGYASDMKAYKLNPEQYKGNVADIAEIIRVALTGRIQSPNLYEIQQVLGIDRITKRFEKFKEICCN